VDVEGNVSVKVCKGVRRGKVKGGESKKEARQCKVAWPSYIPLPVDGGALGPPPVIKGQAEWWLLVVPLASCCSPRMLRILHVRTYNPGLVGVGELPSPNASLGNL
jgi:hypothetical protein